jgi:hypothetical protein
MFRHGGAHVTLAFEKIGRSFLWIGGKSAHGRPRPRAFQDMLTRLQRNCAGFRGMAVRNRNVFMLIPAD